MKDNKRQRKLSYKCKRKIKTGIVNTQQPLLQNQNTIIKDKRQPHDIE